MKGSKLFIFGIFIALFYLSYRYAFQINSSTTSPTYSDTPIILSLGKYIFLSIIFALPIIYFITSKKMSTNVGFIRKYDSIQVLSIIVTFALFSLGITIGLLASNIYAVESIFFLGSIFAFLFFYDFANKYFFILKKYLLHIVFIFIFIDLFQIFLFFYIGRLPALAYENSISVRFGSVFDDSNGFAVFLALFSFAPDLLKNKFNRNILRILIFLCLIATQSLTGISSFIVAYILVLLLRFLLFRKRNDLIFMQVLFFLFGIFIMVIWLYLFEYIQLFIELKSLSAEQHINVFSMLNQITGKTLLVGGSQGMVGESGYLNLLFNFGALFVFLQILLLLLSFLAALRLFYHFKGNNIATSVLSSLLTFILSYSIAMINLPLEGVFPVNMLYYLILYSFLFYRRIDYNQKEI